MNQNWLVLLDSVFNEIEYGLGSCIFGIENNLVFQVKPLERQIHHTLAFPVVLHLLPSTVYDVRYFIRNYEFLILIDAYLS